MLNDGWVKIHRKVLQNPVVMKDADYLAVWIFLLLNAVYIETPSMFAGEKIALKPGQLITSRRVIAEKLSVSESKVLRILNALKSEHQIEQQTSNRNSLISIVRWDLYQESEQQEEQPVNSQRTTSEQQVNNKRTTNDPTHYKKNLNNNNNISKKKNIKKKKVFTPPTLEEVKAYCMERNLAVDPERFFNYFTAGDWIDSKGNQVRNWKQKILTWENYPSKRVGGGSAYEQCVGSDISEFEAWEREHAAVYHGDGC